MDSFPGKIIFFINVKNYFAEICFVSFFLLNIIISSIDSITACLAHAPKNSLFQAPRWWWKVVQ